MGQTPIKENPRMNRNVILLPTQDQEYGVLALKQYGNYFQTVSNRREGLRSIEIAWQYITR